MSVTWKLCAQIQTLLGVFPQLSDCLWSYPQIVLLNKIDLSNRHTNYLKIQTS